jgi:hypothetical protein
MGFNGELGEVGLNSSKTEACLFSGGMPDEARGRKPFISSHLLREWIRPKLKM